MATIDALGTGAIEFEYMLSQLNQSILAKAFRGELVPQDPNDEPASELLARIRREREGEVSGDRVQVSGRKKKEAGKGNVSESARPAKRSKRSSKAASATTPDASADTSPEPARPQRRRRRSSSSNEDASLVIRVLAEGGAVNIHADTSGPTVQFYTKSSGGDDFLAEMEGYDDTESQPRESKRVANLSDLMEPELALLYPKNINPTYLPQLRDWYTWAAPQLPEHFESEFLEQAKFRWSEALQIEEPSTSQFAQVEEHRQHLSDTRTGPAYRQKSATQSRNADLQQRAECGCTALGKAQKRQQWSTGIRPHKDGAEEHPGTLTFRFGIGVRP